MPRGVHANSRANLIRAGGDRTKGKKLVIAAIEKALREMPDGREIRKFFGLHAGQLLKDKHRARWAKVKAPVVYDAMVEAMADEVVTDGERMRSRLIAEHDREIREEYLAEGWTSPADVEEMEAEIEEYAAMVRAWVIETRYGNLNIGGFLRMRATKTRALYPVVSVSYRPVRKDSLEYAWCYFMGADPGYGEFPFRVHTDEGFDWLRWQNPSYEHDILVLAKVRFPSRINVKVYFEGSGQIEESKIDMVTEKVWALLRVPPALSPWAGGGQGYIYVERIIEDEDDWWAALAEIDHPDKVELREMDGAVMKGAALDLLERKPGGWLFEWPLFGDGQGGAVAYIEGLFPRKQVVTSSIDPVRGYVYYEDVQWLDWEEWELRCAHFRGAALAAGAEVPPEAKPENRRALSVTFDDEFIAAINEGQGDAAP